MLRSWLCLLAPSENSFMCSLIGDSRERVLCNELKRAFLGNSRPYSCASGSTRCEMVRIIRECTKRGASCMMAKIAIVILIAGRIFVRAEPLLNNLSNDVPPWETLPPARRESDSLSRRRSLSAVSEETVDTYRVNTNVPSSGFFLRPNDNTDFKSASPDQSGVSTPEPSGLSTPTGGLGYHVPITLPVIVDDHRRQSIPDAPSTWASEIPPMPATNKNHAVCSNGLRLIFDCALRRVVALGIRDRLIEKYKLPMVPLDICQGKPLLELENCVPDDFVQAFPFDIFLDIVRTRRLILGTVDFTAFPQLVADEGYNTGFYPELLHAVVREMTILILQNRGLREEFLGPAAETVLPCNKTFAERVEQMHSTMATGLKEDRSMWNDDSSSHFSRSERFGDKNLNSNGVMDPVETYSTNSSDFGEDTTEWESQMEVSACPPPSYEFSKEKQLGVTHLRFESSLHLVAAVHRGEVHMMDIGTVASSYLPERYNFLSLRDVLEPSCTYGAWKSFLVVRDTPNTVPIGRTRPDPNSPSMNTISSVEESLHHKSHRFESGWGHTERSALRDDAVDGLIRWDDKWRKIRDIFRMMHTFSTDTIDGLDNNTHAVNFHDRHDKGNKLSSEPEKSCAWQPTLVKFHHVDDFSYSYLFPDDFRIYSVRRLTDFSSHLNEGDAFGAFGYGLAARGGKRRRLTIFSYQCFYLERLGRQKEAIQGHRSFQTNFLSNLLGSECLGSFKNASVTRSRHIDTESKGHEVIEFPGPLIPLSAFFAKSTSAGCAGSAVLSAQWKMKGASRMSGVGAIGSAWIGIGLAAVGLPFYI